MTKFHFNGFFLIAFEIFLIISFTMRTNSQQTSPLYTYHEKIGDITKAESIVKSIVSKMINKINF